MERFTRKLSIVLMLVLLFTSADFIGVAATNTDDTSNIETKTEAVVVAPKAVTGLEAHPGYNSVILQWNQVKKADGYIVYKKVGNKYKKIATVKQIKDDKITYKAKGLTVFESYSFQVAAYATGTSGKQLLSAKKSVKGEPVRPMTINLTIKKSGTLRSHAGKKANYRVKAGQVIKVWHFKGGKYIFHHNGSTFFVARARVGNKKAVYTEKFNYSKISAENFVNDRGLSSKTNVLLWVSTYTQHVYMFKGKKGKWKLYDDWECATGVASTPTPTGNNGLRMIHNKIRSRHNLPYWSSFHGTASFHGKHSSWKVGKPYSSGCVRNPNEKAKLVYKQAKIGTRVYIN